MATETDTRTALETARDAGTAEVTVAKAKLADLDTEALIAQYNRAIAAMAGPYGRSYSPHSVCGKRVHHVVRMISARADADDAVALAWYEL